MRTMLLCLMLVCASCATSKSATPNPTTAPTRQPIVIELRLVGEGAAATRDSAEKLIQPSLVVDVRPGQVFAGETQFRDGKLSVDGMLQALPDGRFRANIRYRDESPSGHRGTQTTVELTRGEDFNLSGLMNTYGEDLVILRLQ